jgi:hypothetical protein
MTCRDYEALCARPLSSAPPSMAELDAALRHLDLCPACLDATHRHTRRVRARMSREEDAALEAAAESYRRRLREHLRTDPEAVTTTPGTGRSGGRP